MSNTKTYIKQDQYLEFMYFSQPFSSLSSSGRVWILFLACLSPIYV